MMSKYDLMHTGTLSRASFYLPFNGANVNVHEIDKNFLSQFDYFPVISSTKINNLNTALLFQQLDSNSPSIYYESYSGNNCYAIIATQTDPICHSFDNLEDLRHFLNSTRVPSLDLPFFTGGLIGFWSYDFGLKLFNLPAKNSTTVPKQYFFMPQEVMVYDIKTHILTTIIWVDSTHLNDVTLDSIYHRIAEIETLALSLEDQEYDFNLTDYHLENHDFAVNIPDPEFCEMVKKAQDFINRGEIYQIVLSRCWKKHSSAKPFDVFLALRQINPSPYMFFVKVPDLILIGASPETQVLVQDKKVSVSPIAGTRKICGNQTLDLKAAQELLTNEKELAEHIMLVDLSRSELSQVSKPGTVKVEEMFRLRYFSHVVHLVSTVKSSLSDDYDALEAFKACFPAGTLSGAPKYRAMEIIDELEPTSRGIYGGAVGYIDFNGNLDSCITIRTALYKDGEYIIQSGAGIVADSDPKKECLETYYKARALMTTIQAVEGKYHDFDHRQ